MRLYEFREIIPNDGALRKAVIKALFSQEDLMGARWEVPGWAEINAGLDAAGIVHSMRPTTINIEDDVLSLGPEELHDVILSLVYTREQMLELGPHTPGLAQILNGMAKRGIETEDGQLSVRGLPYGDPYEAEIVNGERRFEPPNMG